MKTQQEKELDSAYRHIGYYPCGARGEGNGRETAVMQVYLSGSGVYDRQYVTFSAARSHIRMNSDDAIKLCEALIDALEDE